MTQTEILAIAKPILFNTEMVRAILEDRKTTTRRVVKKKLVDDVLSSPARLGNPNIADRNFITCLCNAPYEAGDLLYVRETWGRYKVCGGISYAFKADYVGDNENERKAKCLCHKWRPSIHMPKEAARLFLRVTSVRVERLQDITVEQCEKEGMTEKQKSVLNKEEYWYWFKELWNNTIKKTDLDRYGWNANPWVWVIKFERVSANE